MEGTEEVQSALSELVQLAEAFYYRLPLFGIALLIICFAFILARMARRALEWLLSSHIETALLRRLYAQLFAVGIFLAGCYLALRVASLTQLAITVLGGTGLAGLVFGFAFRDIAENFLASVILSIQRPFQLGDVVELDKHIGIVEKMTVRCTVIMNFEGDHVQIPNATVFRSSIRNLTANPNQRSDFTLGIGYDAPIGKAQQIARTLIEEHPLILDTPEPWILVDSLGSSTVNLRLYFWVDITKNNMLKVRSSLMRSLVAAFLSEGISMPDEAREIVFPEGIPLQVDPTALDPMVLSAEQRTTQAKEYAPSGVKTKPSLEIEGNFESEYRLIRQQMQQARPAAEGKNLIDSD